MGGGGRRNGSRWAVGGRRWRVLMGGERSSVLTGKRRCLLVRGGWRSRRSRRAVGGGRESIFM